MLYQDDFERALKSENPISQLRQLALKLHSEGNDKQQIYDRFHDFYKYLQDNERGRDEDLLGDVMDMITGTYEPYNISFPTDNMNS